MKMWFERELIFLQILCCSFFVGVHSNARLHHYEFTVEEAQYTRLCSIKSILTVNGQFPGPTIRTSKGESVYVNVYNEGRHNITFHWHEVKQPRNPWADGPVYITQCPIRPGHKVRYKLIFSTEEGTLWWHAHSDWARATVHGAIFFYPRDIHAYTFPKPDAEVPIILGEWWKQDVVKVLTKFLRTVGAPNDADAVTINGQPGDMYPCSKSGTFQVNVDQGKTYHLPIVNAAIDLIFLFSISKHKLTVVGADGSYTKPLTRDCITISPRQTVDVMFIANRKPDHYHMAARAYSNTPNLSFDNGTTIAILQCNNGNHISSSSPSLPYLPYHNDTKAAFHVFGSLRGLPKKYFRQIPLDCSSHIVFTLSINTLRCPKGHSCEGPNGTDFTASMNNISFGNPSIDILEAYYYHINGVFARKFPRFPPKIFNFTAEYLPLILEIPKRGAQAIVLNYGANVELVLQSTNLVGGIDHPIHLHGCTFLVVGYGFGNFEPGKDPLKYNLIDPPLVNTVTVPINA